MRRVTDRPARASTTPLARRRRTAHRPAGSSRRDQAAHRSRAAFRCPIPRAGACPPRRSSPWPISRSTSRPQARPGAGPEVAAPGPGAMPSAGRSRASRTRGRPTRTSRARPPRARPSGRRARRPEGWTTDPQSRSPSARRPRPRAWRSPPASSRVPPMASRSRWTAARPRGSATGRSPRCTPRPRARRGPGRSCPASAGDGLRAASGRVTRPILRSTGGTRRCSRPSPSRSPRRSTIHAGPRSTACGRRRGSRESPRR